MNHQEGGFLGDLKRGKTDSPQVNIDRTSVIFKRFSKFG
jgi:hypothetical protein